MGSCDLVFQREGRMGVFGKIGGPVINLITFYHSIHMKGYYVLVPVQHTLTSEADLYVHVAGLTSSLHPPATCTRLNSILNVEVTKPNHISINETMFISNVQVWPLFLLNFS